MSLACSCKDDEHGFVVPTPDPDKEQEKEENGGDQGGENQSPEVASLCNPEDLGQTPMIIAYYTENSSSLPDPSCLTHIN